MKKFSALAVLVLMFPSLALAADRIPVAVVWMGDGGTLDEGGRVTGELHKVLSRSKIARGIDGTEDRRFLVEGAGATRAAQLQARSEASFGKLRYADAARDLEAAEAILLGDVPISVTQERLGAVERMLLACYDQLGRGPDAARAAERLSWTAGTKDDVQNLLDRHAIWRQLQPPFGPISIVTVPPGAVVYRNLQPVGPTPVIVAGGDAALDAVDIEAPGFRRAHQPLGHVGGELLVTLVPEDRLGALVDTVRAQAEPSVESVIAVGKRVGAERVLLLSPDGPKLIARAVDVKKGSWYATAIRTDSQGPVAMEKISAYVVPPPKVAAAPTVAVQAVAPPKKKWGSWGKWYTWVAAGGVVLLVGGLLIAQNVGSDSLKVTVEKK